MREAEVVAAFYAALRADGWDVRTEVDFVDVVAERGQPASRLSSKPSNGVTAGAG